MKQLLKTFTLGLIFAVTMLFGFFAFAQEATLEVVSDASFFKQLFDLVVGYKALGGAAATIAIVQLLIMFLKTELFGKLFKYVTGQTKLLIVSGLTLVIGVLTLKQQGLSTAQALGDSSTLLLLQVFAHQVYLQFFVKKN